MSSETLNIIKDSFERWYNSTISKKHPVSVVINYSDTQTLYVKAYHTVTLEMKIVGIKDNLSYTTSIVTLKENYNHGITTEEEAKTNLIKKLLVELFNYHR